VGKLVLVVIVVAVAVAFTVLQLRARSHPRRSPDAFDWRAFPLPTYEAPPEESDPGWDDEALFADEDCYGVVWENWSPRGHGGVYLPWNPQQPGSSRPPA
jgi:hypothetical protein